MSTRANIIIKDSYDKLFFYRHSDGYPNGALPTLRLFQKWLVEEKIRDNVAQAAGWLILIGAMEYKTLSPKDFESKREWDYNVYGSPADKPPRMGMGWKCGAYEPTTAIHGDIQWLYEIDLDKKTIEIYREWNDQGGIRNLMDEFMSIHPDGTNYEHWFQTV